MSSGISFGISFGMSIIVVLLLYLSSSFSLQISLFGLTLFCKPSRLVDNISVLSVKLSDSLALSVNALFDGASLGVDEGE